MHLQFDSGQLLVLQIAVVAAIVLVLQHTSVAQQSTLGEKQLSKLVIDASSYDFGTVDRGVRLKHTFQVRNSGNGILNIQRAYATCGCTIPQLEKTKLLPGESTKLKVTVDTAMKQNRITKSVYVISDDLLRPTEKVDLIMNVVDPHRGMTAAGRAKIFTDQQCAACHVARGIGLVGRDLYNADCAMCHGPKAEGEIGPALIGPYECAAYAHRMADIASFGSPQHSSMPGFLAEAGGPLTKTQIDSILHYLADLSNKRRQTNH